MFDDDEAELSWAKVIFVPPPLGEPVALSR